MTTRLMRSMRRISIAALGLLLVAGASTQLSASAFAADMPPTAKINVTPAKYKGDDNLIEFVGTKDDHYRFVIEIVGKNNSYVSIQARKSIRDKIMSGKPVSVEKLLAEEYPGVTLPYGDNIFVGVYWFDKEKAYDPKLWNDQELTVGAPMSRLIRVDNNEAGDPAAAADPATLPENPAAKPADPKPQDKDKKVDDQKADAAADKKPAAAQDDKAATPVPVQPATPQASQEHKKPAANAQPGEQKLADTGDDQFVFGAASVAMALSAVAIVLVRRRAQSEEE